MRNYLVVLLLIAQSVFAADPTISGASLSSGTLTITGSNFGSKSTAAPVFWQNFSTTTTGDSVIDAGYADMSAYGAGAWDSVDVDMAKGRQAGLGALKFLTGPGDGNRESFPHVAIQGLDTPELYHSYWFKITRTVSGAATGPFQIKGPRAGNGLWYGDDPKMTSSFYPVADLSTYDYTNLSWRNSSGVELGSIGGQADDNDQFPVPAYKTGWNSAGWNFIQTWEKMNSVGSANGFQRVSINNKAVTGMITANENNQPVLNPGENFNFVYLIPGVDLPASDLSEYELLFAEHYVDTTPQRVMLGNASSLSAVTGGTMCIPTAWSTGITCTAANIPSGYDWAYVTNELGETNATGFAYTAGGGGGDATATPTGVTLTLAASNPVFTASSAATPTIATMTVAANDATFGGSSAATPTNVVSILSASNATASGSAAASTYPAIGPIKRTLKRNIPRTLKRQ